MELDEVLDIGKIIRNFLELIIPKRLINEIYRILNGAIILACPKQSVGNVIGRENDLQTLWKTLKEKKHVILTGFGGIGKTKLALLLFHKYKDKFCEVAWIDYKGDLKSSILNNLTDKRVEKYMVDKKYTDDRRWNATS